MEKKQRTSQIGYFLHRYLKPQAGQVFLLLLCLFIDIGLQLLNPQLLRAFIDQVASKGPAAPLLLITILYIGIVFLTQALAVAVTYLSAQIAWTSTNRLRVELMEHCLRQDLRFHSERTPGELIERIDGDVNALSNFFSLFVFNVLGNILLLTGVLLLLFREDWHVGLALTLFSVIAVFTLYKSRQIAGPAIYAYREANASTFGFIEERLRGIDDIRANGGGAYVMLRFVQLARDFYQKGWKAAAYIHSFTALTTFMFAIGYAIALTMGVYLFTRSAITIGTIYLFFQYTTLIRQPLENITQEFRDLQSAGTNLKRIQDLYEIQPAIADGAGAALPSGPLEISFSNVTFAYGTGEAALSDMTFTLPAGQTLGLIGRTGSGKTTLSRLLCRLYDLSTGTIRAGAVDIKDAYLSDLRQRIGVVTQDIQLFHASVRDNITLFDPGIPDQRIVEVIKALGLDAWYQSLPHGLETPIASSGHLSTGEAQLLAFARVFLKDPGLIILDEATSHLDPATQQLIEQACHKLLAGRTAIIIAHRLETLQHVDRILLLEQGQIKEYGAREALAQDAHSYFARLLHTGNAFFTEGVDQLFENMTEDTSSELTNEKAYRQLS